MRRTPWSSGRARTATTGHKAWFEGDERLGHGTYPVIADTTHALGRAFGVLAADGSTHRGTFLIDPLGELRHVLINDSDRDGGGVGRNVGETLRTLRALRTGELCQADWHPGDATLTAASITALS